MASRARLPSSRSAPRNGRVASPSRTALGFSSPTALPRFSPLSRTGSGFLKPPRTSLLAVRGGSIFHNARSFSKPKEDHDQGKTRYRKNGEHSARTRPQHGDGAGKARERKRRELVAYALFGIKRRPRRVERAAYGCPQKHERCEKERPRNGPGNLETRQADVP